MKKPLLSVNNLCVDFQLDGRTVRAVDNVSFEIGSGEILGTAGESGSGKSVTTTAMMRLLNNKAAKVTGEVVFDGTDLLALPLKEMRRFRGKDISMIFQDPMNSLTPVYTVGSQIVEQIRIHEKVTKAAAKARAIELLKRVRIPAPEQRYNAYPHELSGGMRQRIAIAMALSCSPRLLIADEPTTALDVTTQAQVLGLMRELKDDFDTSIILITHDMGVLAGMCDRIQIMYSGRIIESGPRRQILDAPRHPYTWGLLGAVPSVRGKRVDRLVAIPGSAPGAQEVEKLEGCGFRNRCPLAFDKCETTPRLPGLVSDLDHVDACWLPEDSRAELRSGLEANQREKHLGIEPVVELGV